MRQPGSTSNHRRYADYGHMPHPTSGSSMRGNHTPTRHHPPDISVETSERSSRDHYDRSVKDYHDRNHYTTAMSSINSSSDSPNMKIGAASNPNRSDVPGGGVNRRKFDPVC